MPSKTSKPAKSKQSGRPIPAIDPNSSLTPENFEKQLKALAAKAQDETWSNFLRSQGASYAKIFLLLCLIGVSSNVSQLALSPVYGSIPAAQWHRQLVMVSCFAGWSSNLFLNRRLPIKLEQLLPVLAAYIPMTQFYLYKLSEPLGLPWGPLVTEALTIFPLISLSVACVANYWDNVDLTTLPKWLADAAPGLASYAFMKLVERVFGGLIQSSMGSSFLQSRIGLELVLAASYTLFAPSKLMAAAIPPLLHTAFLNTHVPSPMALNALNKTMNAQGWSIIDRRESLTGYISVMDSFGEGFRVMRCDHSLLGGEWIKYAGVRVAEPIYGVFAMLEAVRLIEVPKPVKDSKAKALVIGMGIGTTPAALVAHGIDTTVVEIDPVVQEFASKYFHLPSNHTSVVEDAVSYTARLAQQKSPRFDYIVHDVFTGGAEPIALFTLEFLQHLDILLKPNGVIAINYAGDFTLPPPTIIVNTIKQVFPSCRIYREHPREKDTVEREGGDFINMVIFCKRTSGKLRFRKPNAEDLLHSPTRRQFLVPQHEVFAAAFAAGQEDGILTSNDTEKLAKWHEQSAVKHWEVMRTVLPSVVWENW